MQVWRLASGWLVRLWGGGVTCEGDLKRLQGLENDGQDRYLEGLSDRTCGACRGACVWSDCEELVRTGVWNGGSVVVKGAGKCLGSDEVVEECLAGQVSEGSVRQGGTASGAEAEAEEAQDESLAGQVEERRVRRGAGDWVRSGGPRRGEKKAWLVRFRKVSQTGRVTASGAEVSGGARRKPGGPGIGRKGLSGRVGDSGSGEVTGWQG